MPIPLAQGGFKGYHNYFVPDEYFREDTEDGILRLRDGQRAARVSEDFIAGLHHGLDEEVGAASGLIMYQCGVNWARHDMKRFNERMRHEFGGGKLDIWQMNRKFVLESWWWPLTITGWGSWTVDLSNAGRGLTLIEVRNSAVAQSMKQIGKPVCNAYAGLFAGAMSFLDRTERSSIEVQCYAMGNDVCKFLVGDEKEVNAAEFWRTEGASGDEILGRVIQ
jgi:predicted hydrocarbon binding protein